MGSELIYTCVHMVIKFWSENFRYELYELCSAQLHVHVHTRYMHHALC